MKIERDYVLAYLRKLEEQYSGYFGTDIFNLAEELGVTWYGLRKKLNEWFKIDPDFSNFHYLGRHRPSITPNEFIEIKSRVAANPLEVKSRIYSDINKERADSNEKSLTKPTFYRAVERIHIDKRYPWFSYKKIELPLTDSVVDARDSLSTIFSYSDLKTYGGADIQAIYERWIMAKEWFSVYGIEPILFYLEILQRERQQRSLLTSIQPNRQEDIQARLAFEIQVVFMVECLKIFFWKRSYIEEENSAINERFQAEKWRIN